MLSRIKQSFWVLLLMIIIQSCAQVVAPTGGEKDTAAPEVLELSPQQEQLNFNEEKIKITFSEFVKLVKFKDELLVSPPLEYPLQTKLKGKSLELIIEDTLKENTTYILNFGKSVVDITENNPVENFFYVFSTGDHIDSLSVKGRVKDAFSSEVEKDVLVMLYAQFQDSIPFLALPDYMARTDEEGVFSITNVKKGQYKVFAMVDANNNYMLDKADKRIAFDTNLIALDSNIEGLNFNLFEEDNRQQYIKKQTESGAVVTLEFNTTFDSLKYQFLDTSRSEVLKFSYEGVNKDSLVLFFNEMDNQKLKLDIQLDTNFRDTITLKIDSMKGQLKTTVPSNQPFYKALSIGANFPIDTVHKDSIEIMSLKDSTFLDFDIKHDRLAKSCFIEADLQEGENYKIRLLPNTIKDLYGRSNDSIFKRFSITKARSYGNLFIQIEQTIDQAIIVQLMSGRDKVLRQQFLDVESELEFLHLKPGEYGLRLIVDDNGDQQWTTGDYMKSLYPERVVNYTEPITIRSNWDQEINWKIDWKE